MHQTIQKAKGAPTGQIWDNVNIKMNSDGVVEQTQGDSETGKPGVLQLMGLQGVRYDLATDQQGKIIMILKDLHILISKTFEHVRLHCRGKLRLLINDLK